MVPFGGMTKFFFSKNIFIEKTIIKLYNRTMEAR